MVLEVFKCRCISQNITNKTWSTKNQENSAHHFGDNYLTNHRVRFLQDRIKPWRARALRVWIGYNFFWGKSLVRVFSPPLTFRMVPVNNNH